MQMYHNGMPSGINFKEAAHLFYRQEDLISTYTFCPMMVRVITFDPEGDIMLVSWLHRAPLSDIRIEAKNCLYIPWDTVNVGHIVNSPTNVDLVQFKLIVPLFFPQSEISVHRTDMNAASSCREILIKNFLKGKKIVC